MKIDKVNTHLLEKCYSIAPLEYNNQNYILVAAEKVNKCLLFDLDGNLIDTIWDGPGGTMSMVQIPNSNGQFLATQRFYSPNDSKTSKIVLVTPISKGNWDIRTIARIPFVHRFDILTRKDKHYLIACTIKSAHAYKDDWSHPGEILVAELPKENTISKTEELKFRVIKEGLLKNHGYCHIQREKDKDYALIGCQSGVFEVIPPSDNQDWQVNPIMDDACSDMALVDFDNDGEEEMIVISPFHGDELKIYKKINDKYEVVYQHFQPTEFGHAIWAGTLYGKNCAIIGHRQGSRDLLLIYYQDGYQFEVLDKDVGPANVYRYKKGLVECLVSTNREIDEIAFYEFSQ